MKNNSPVRTRIAPSPTGYPHIGTIYQVLFDFAYARKFKGEFVLRIEDTDRARFVEGAEEVIYDSLEWFELVPDESPRKGGNFGPYKQSERLDIYQSYINQLVEKGDAYYCFCTKERLEKMREEQVKNKKTPMYDRTCRDLSKEIIAQKIAEHIPYVVRMKIPDNRKIIFNDLIIGKIEFDSSAIDDQVIQKSDGFPTYHLAVVVDDHLMKISHIFRGKEWISSTPKHVLLYEFFGWEIPQHAHLPLLLNSDGKGKLSKRHGHSSVNYYREKGFLPEAILNYLSNIVWNHPEGKEIYSFEEFIRLFQIQDITSQGARFDLKKLVWMNQQYIQRMNNEELIKRISVFYPEKKIDYKTLHLLIPLLKTRMETLGDFGFLTQYFFSELKSSPRDKKEEEIVKDLESNLAEITDWKSENIFIKFKYIMDKYKVRMSVIYYLMTGFEKGLPLPEALEILGRDLTLSRLKPIN